MSNSELRYTSKTPSGTPMRRHPASAMAALVAASPRLVQHEIREAMTVKTYPRKSVAKHEPRVTDGVDYPVTVTTVQKRADESA